MQAEFAVIGGTGVYNPRMLTDIQELTVDTQYGAVPLKIGKLENKKVAFLADRKSVV